MSRSIFKIQPSKANPLPILISVPHCGTKLPQGLEPSFHSNVYEGIDDTDFFVDKLYNFAPDLGITVIQSEYSRYVIDLNRDPQNKALYNDGRVITELVPTKNFFGEDLYQNQVPNPQQIQSRFDQFYSPYHQKIQELLAQMKEQFSHVLLWEAHSIRQHIPPLHPQPFPDLILGDQNGKTASESLIQCACENLSNEGYHFSHNTPFRGGFITRNFGKPEDGIHAIQLEMTKVNYMDEEKTLYQTEKANMIRSVLQKTLLALNQKLQEMNH